MVPREVSRGESRNKSRSVFRKECPGRTFKGRFKGGFKGGFKGSTGSVHLRRQRLQPIQHVSRSIPAEHLRNPGRERQHPPAYRFGIDSLFFLASTLWTWPAPVAIGSLVLATKNKNESKKKKLTKTGSKRRRSAVSLEFTDGFCWWVCLVSPIYSFFLRFTFRSSGSSESGCNK